MGENSMHEVVHSQLHMQISGTKQSVHFHTWIYHFHAKRLTFMHENIQFQCINNETIMHEIFMLQYLFMHETFLYGLNT